jgi:hypothetical protein
MPRVLFESEAGYPAARWLHSLLTADAVFLEPNWSAMRQASPPGQPKVITANGRNIPWLALELKREGAPEALRLDYRSERYADWIAHVQTALPQVTDIEVREREDDHHAYFVVSYKGDFKVPSLGLSDGTLRILTLTLLPYLSKQPAILVTEEPENGIHPRAIEAVLQSLSSMYDSQVWVSSHSPVVLGRAKLDQLLCATACQRRRRGDGCRAPIILACKSGAAASTLAACSQRGCWDDGQTPLRHLGGRQQYGRYLSWLLQARTVASEPGLRTLRDQHRCRWRPDRGRRRQRPRRLHQGP